MLVARSKAAPEQRWLPHRISEKIVLLSCSLAPLLLDLKSDVRVCIVDWDRRLRRIYMRPNRNHALLSLDFRFVAQLLDGCACLLKACVNH
jgi:hypothetical protein